MSLFQKAVRSQILSSSIEVGSKVNLKHLVLRGIYEYWRERVGNQTFMTYEAFDILEVPPDVVSHLVLIDAPEGGQRLWFRLTGTTVDDWNGFNATGQT